LIVYLDTSVLVSLFVPDEFSIRARAYLQAAMPAFSVSDYACAEFSSVIARLVRVREVEAKAAPALFAGFDAWVAAVARKTMTTSADIEAANSYLRRLDTTLRAPDAIHLAMAQRLEAELATFDHGLAESARRVKVRLAPL